MKRNGSRDDDGAGTDEQSPALAVWYVVEAVIGTVPVWVVVIAAIYLGADVTLVFFPTAGVLTLVGVRVLDAVSSGNRYAELGGLDTALSVLESVILHSGIVAVGSLVGIVVLAWSGWLVWGVLGSGGMSVWLLRHVQFFLQWDVEG